jgi:hypothetical protein
MARTQADYDPEYRAVADEILDEVASAIREDLIASARGGLVDRNAPHTVQHEAARYVLRAAGDEAWRRIQPSTAQTADGSVIVGWPGQELGPGLGDAPWLIGLWWYGTQDPDDPIVRRTYDMIAESETGKYVFNRGWMAVYAAKLGLGEDAAAWLHALLDPTDALHDDTALGEIVHDFEDHEKTPEIAAHGALLCAVSKMLLDADEPRLIRLFPAVPASWQEEGCSFANLPAPSALRVGARLGPEGAWAEIRNIGPDQWHGIVTLGANGGPRKEVTVPPGAHIECWLGEGEGDHAG